MDGFKTKKPVMARAERTTVVFIRPAGVQLVRLNT
jgi:hypothetical protein